MRTRWPEATTSAVSGSQLPTFHVGARIGLTPPIRRMPPEQQAGLPRADHETYVRLAFDIVQGSSRRVASGSLLRSSSRSIPDDLEDRLFRDVHHPGRCAGAAHGGLQPPPARAAAEGLPPSPTQHCFGAPLSTQVHLHIRGTNRMRTTPRSSLAISLSSSRRCGSSVRVPFGGPPWTRTKYLRVSKA